VKDTALSFKSSNSTLEVQYLLTQAHHNQNTQKLTTRATPWSKRDTN
jgi:hypothetical protein